MDDSGRVADVVLGRGLADVADLRKQAQQEVV